MVGMGPNNNAFQPTVLALRARPAAERKRYTNG